MNIPLKQSYLYLAIFCIISIITASLLILLGSHWYCKLITVVLLVFGNGWFLRNYFFECQQNSIIKLTKLTKEVWKIDYQSGKSFIGVLQGSSLTTSLFSILILQDLRKTSAFSLDHLLTHFFKKSILVFKDSMSNKDYHFLQLHLKGLLSD